MKNRQDLLPLPCEREPPLEIETRKTEDPGKSKFLKGQILL